MHQANALQPLGWFHATATRDAEAQNRDGLPFVAMNWLRSADGGSLAEVQFGDGYWMLAEKADLQLVDD